MTRTIQVAGDTNVKRACMAAENLDVAAGHSKMLAVLSQPQGNTVAGPPGAGFGGRKGPNSMGKISTLGVLRLRATKRCVTRSICKALRSESVTLLVSCKIRC